MRRLLLAVLLILPLAACKPDCNQLKMIMETTCAPDQTSTACVAARLAYTQADCKDQPATCPTRCPAGQECTDPAKGCQPIAPKCPEQCEGNAICTDPAVGCRPVTCADLQCTYGCDELSTGSVCKPKPPTTCDPACAADEKCVQSGTVTPVFHCEKIPGPPTPGLIPDEELTVVPGDMNPQMWGQVEAAIGRFKSLHAELWNTDKTCLSNGAAGIDNAFAGIATELARVTIIAGQSITKDGQRSDALFVNRTGTKRYEEYHLFDYARGCVATGTNSMKGVYLRSGDDTVPPPVSDTCPYEPCPAREWTAETLPPGWDSALIGKPSYIIQWHSHTMGNNDSTPYLQRQCSYCNEVMNDPNRCGCPVRPDGHVERVPVEDWLMYGGFRRDSRNGQDCTPNDTDNPAAWLAGTGDCRMCNSKPNDSALSVCTEWN
jgi:hypothetical protein